MSGIQFPTAFFQSQFVNQVGTLQIGLDADPLKQQFIFTLDAKGKAKATDPPVCGI